MAKLSVKELIELKNKRQIVVTTAFDEWTAKACEDASIDMILTWSDTVEKTRTMVNEVRSGAPNTLIGSGIPSIGAYSSEQEALRLAGEYIAMGVDIIYCSGLVPDTFAALRRHHYPCVGHVGYLPVQDTWFGGPRAVGKKSEEAIKVYENTLALQDAGVVAVEMECVPADIAAEISKRVDILVISMGSGPQCDGQFLFACDILGTHDGHYPRHSKTYANLRETATNAMTQYKDDVLSQAYPEKKHNIKIKEEEYGRFMDALEKKGH
jgi:3-methyl-2-oxobutanoate hydroxymethyltransferase